MVKPGGRPSRSPAWLVAATPHTRRVSWRGCGSAVAAAPRGGVRAGHCRGPVAARGVQRGMPVHRRLLAGCPGLLAGLPCRCGGLRRPPGSLGHRPLRARRRPTSQLDTVRFSAVSMNARSVDRRSGGTRRSSSILRLHHDLSAPPTCRPTLTPTRCSASWSGWPPTRKTTRSPDRSWRIRTSVPSSRAAQPVLGGRGRVERVWTRRIIASRDPSGSWRVPDFVNYHSSLAWNTMRCRSDRPYTAPGAVRWLGSATAELAAAREPARPHQDR